MTERDYDWTEDFEKGVNLRKAVLGDAHVDRSLEKGKEDPFMMPIQQLTTDVGWGKVWARPGLERRERSMLSVTLLAALGKREELKTHLQGALNNGVTRGEIQEVLLHTTVYAGFPVGLDSFRVAKELFDDLDAKADRKDEVDPE
jgi:4-carboxymuconolactone decarboxylase